jgi:hypothetical protein
MILRRYTKLERAMFKNMNKEQIIRYKRRKFHLEKQMREAELQALIYQYEHIKKFWGRT